MGLRCLSPFILDVTQVKYLYSCFCKIPEFSYQFESCKQSLDLVFPTKRLLSFRRNEAFIVLLRDTFCQLLFVRREPSFVEAWCFLEGGGPTEFRA